MATTKTAWKANRRHKDVVLPSGAEIDIELPNLGELMRADQIPNHLVPFVIKAEKGAIDLDQEKAKEAARFQAWVVALTVVDPELVPRKTLLSGEPNLDEIAQAVGDTVPAEDVDLIYQIAMRNRDIDAAGQHLGGLERLDTFRRFRGIDGAENPLGL